MLKDLIKYPSYFEMHSALLDDIEEMLATKDLTHYASQLLQNGLQDDELDEALCRAIKAVTTARLPVTRHFKKVFISYGGEIKKDWLVSDLGLRLIVLNADVENPLVARLQVEILSNK